MSVGPPSEVALDDLFLRRVLHRAEFLVWHDDFNRWVPSLAGIRFDPDGMSAFVRRLLEQQGDGAADVSTLGGTSLKPAVVYEFGVPACSEAGFAAEHAPNDDTPIGYAHASILMPNLTREAERRARTKLASEMSLVHGTISLPRPDGA